MKKAQAQIISTVLIILLVLAAIVIVWQVVNSTIQQGGQEILTKTDCIGATLDIEKATTAASNNLMVRRGTGGPNLVTVYVLPTGALKVENNTAIEKLEIATLTVGGLSVGQEIKAGVRLEDGTLCDPIATATVTAS